MKMVIKSGVKHTSEEKLRALTLLDLCLIGASSNDGFIQYAQKKLMKRFRALAAHCPRDLDISDARTVYQRGGNIFLQNEPDTFHASLFLVKLLECVRSWAETYPNDGA